MRNNKCLSLTLVGLILVFTVLAAGCAAPEPSGEGEATSGSYVPDPMPTDPNSPQALTDRRCSMCHSLDRVYEADLDRAGWQETMERMQTLGLVVTDEEFQVILDFLSER